MKTTGEATLVVIFALGYIMFISVIGSVLAETVSDGYIHYLSEDDFSTRTIHPLNYLYGGSYLPEGAGEIAVEFSSASGTGSVTLEASSDAFVGDTSTTEDIDTEKTSYFFILPYTVKTDIDGKYTVQVEARNHIGDILDVTSISLDVWSDDHIEAADESFLLQNRLSTGYGYLFPMGQVFNSPQGRTNFNTAVNEFNSALVAFHKKQWDTAKQHCQEASSYLDKAMAAEVGWSQLSIGDPISYVTLMVIGVLVIVYLIVAIWQKIRPISKT